MKYFVILLLSVFLFACNEAQKDDSKPEANAEMENGELPEGHPDIDDMESMGKNMGQATNTVNITDGRIFLGNFSLKVPDEWAEQQPSSNMRIIEFVPKSNEELVIAGFYFGNNPSMIEGNIERWEKEFVKLDNSKEEAMADGKITYVQLEGTYKLKPAPMAQQFKETPDYMTLACIIPTEQGPYFFKVFGPKNELSKEINNFKSFLDSYRIEADV